MEINNQELSNQLNVNNFLIASETLDVATLTQKYAISKENLEQVQELWKDAPSVEELLENADK